MRVVDIQEMHAIEKAADAEFGFNEGMLIENVGMRGADLIYQKFLKFHAYGEIVVLIGRGNNGADGLCVARHLRRYHSSIRCFTLFSKEECSAEMLRQMAIAEKYGVKISEIKGHEQLSDYFIQTQSEYFVIDAIFGTGVHLPLSNFMMDVISLANAYASVMVSIDIPSGIMGETGSYIGTAIKADLTVAVGLPKVGHYVADGPMFMGELAIIDGGLPRKLLEGGDKIVLTSKNISKLLFSRDQFAQKNSFGHTLVVGGSTGMTGACILAARGALSVGSGLVTALTWEKNYYELVTRVVPEIMTAAISEDEDEALKMLEKIGRFNSVVIGPGLGKSAEARRVVQILLAHFEGPIVIDADAINVLSLQEDMGLFQNRKAPTVLTPHLGEFARLTGTSVESVKERPLEHLQKLVGELGCAVVLKGPCTYLGIPSGEIYINYSPNEGMATGGTGDVLAGILGGLFAQQSFTKTSKGMAKPIEVSEENLSLGYRAVGLGAVVHSLAGKYAAKKLGKRSMKAGHIVDFLSRAFQELEKLENS